MHDKERFRCSAATSSSQGERKFVLEEVFWVPEGNSSAKHINLPVPPEHCSEGSGYPQSLKLRDDRVVGMGLKDYWVIFVFENDNLLTRFLDSGWPGSAQTDLAAKAGAAYSGAAEVAPGVWVCQITVDGLALQSTLQQGTQFSKDGTLIKGSSRSR
jgi:hypothetical protein